MGVLPKLTEFKYAQILPSGRLHHKFGWSQDTLYRKLRLISAVRRCWVCITPLQIMLMMKTSLALRQTLTPYSGCDSDSRLTLGGTILQKMVQKGKVLGGSPSQTRKTPSPSNSKNTLNEPPLLFYSRNAAMCLFKAAAACLFYSTLLELFSRC